MPSGAPDARGRAKQSPSKSVPSESVSRSGSRFSTEFWVFVVMLFLLAVCGGTLVLIVGRNPALLKGGGWIAAFVVLVTFLAWANARKQRLALKRALGLAPNVKEVARRLDVPEEKLRAHRPSYREVRIPKKRGGQRILHVPDDETKALQRRILHRLLGRMKSHPAAYGFERGRSIAHNAAQHTGRALVLRFDVVDFFPRTHADRIEKMFLRFGWSAEAAALLAGLVTHEGGLPQGAPTSPRLSNLVNVGLDRELNGWITRRSGRYTRYADDVTISFPENWIGEPERTGAAVREAFSRRGYKIHGKEKTSVRRRHQRQLVNGLVVNSKVALPRELRRRLRAARHHVKIGRPCTFTADQLQGWTAFESMVREQGAKTPEPWVRPAPGASSTRRRP